MTDEIFGLPLEEQQAFAREHRLREAKIPPILGDATLVNFEAPTEEHREILAFSLDFLKMFVEPQGRNKHSLLLYGPIGRGKSHLAVGILKALILREFYGLFLSVPQWLDDIRATFSSMGVDEPHQSDYINAAQEAEILVLDELGADPAHPWQQSIIHNLICYRYNQMKCTIITTNLDWPKEFEQRCGDRVASRIQETYHHFGPGPNENWRKR